MTKALLPPLLVMFSKNWSTYFFAICQRWSQNLNEVPVPAFYMQSVDFDQGTHYSNNAKLKGLQKYQRGKAEQKVHIESSSLWHALLMPARDCNLTLVVSFPWKDWPGLTTDFGSTGTDMLFLYTTKCIAGKHKHGSDPCSAFRGSVPCLFTLVRVWLKYLWE